MMEREVGGGLDGIHSECCSCPLVADGALFFRLSGCCACWSGARFVLVSLVRVEEEQLEEEDDRETVQAVEEELEGSSHIAGMAVAPGRLGGG